MCHRYWIVNIKPTKLAVLLHLCRNQFLLNLLFGGKYIYLNTKGLFYEKHSQGWSFGQAS